MEVKPIRVQRKRVKGWKMPPNTISVTRPGEWGNPFKIGHHYKWGGLSKSGIDNLMLFVEAYKWEPGFTTIKTAAQAIEWYEIYITKVWPGRSKDAKHELKGKNLACFCPLTSPCHADVLLKIANNE